METKSGQFLKNKSQNADARNHLFASRLSHQLKVLILLTLDNISQRTDPMWQYWLAKEVHSLSPISLITKLLSKGETYQINTMILTASTYRERFCTQSY